MEVLLVRTVTGLKPVTPRPRYVRLRLRSERETGVKGLTRLKNLKRGKKKGGKPGGNPGAPVPGNRNGENGGKPGVYRGKTF